MLGLVDREGAREGCFCERRSRRRPPSLPGFVAARVEREDDRKECVRRTMMLHRGVRARVRVVCVCGLGTEDAGGEELRRRVKIPVGNARPTSLHLL